MRVKATTRVRAMVRAHPHLKDVLGWHDVEVDEDIMAMTIQDICEELGLDLDEVLEDIHAAQRDAAGVVAPVVREEEEEEEEAELEEDDTATAELTEPPPEGEEEIDIDEEDEDYGGDDEDEDDEGEAEEPDEGDWE